MEIQPIQILLQVINFGVVAFVLIKFLYNPIAKVLEARSEKIKAGMDAAEKNLSEKEKLETQVKSELSKARKEANEIIANAKKDAEAKAGEIIAEAKAQAKKAQENERKTFESMLAESKAKAEADLKNLVIATTAKVLKNGLSAADQQKIIDNQTKLLQEVKFV